MDHFEVVAMDGFTGLKGAVRPASSGQLCPDALSAVQAPKLYSV